jgi:PAS domain S-box-containing protein
MPSEEPGVLRRTAIGAGVLAALIGGGHLAAWIGGLMPQGPSTTITMKTNTGVGLLLSGLALVLLALRPRQHRTLRAARACAVFVLLLGHATVTEHVLGWNAGIDQLLATEQPGAAATASPNRMGPPASAALVLLGTALLLLAGSRTSARGRSRHQPFAVMVVVLGLLAVIGYLYGASELYDIARLTDIALPTALTLIILGVGLLCADPDAGVMARVTASDPGGALVRGLLGPMILMPLLLGWLRLTGERLGWFDAAMGTGLTMLVFIVAFSSLLLFAGQRVSAAAAELAASEREARSQKDRLAETSAVLAEGQRIAHVGSFEYIAESRTTAWSEEQYRIYGLDPARSSPSYDAMLAQNIHPDDAALLQSAFTAAMGSGATYELEHRIVRPDGTVRWVYDRAQPYFDEQGKLERYIGVTQDITDRKAAEEELRQNEQRLALAASATGIGVFTSSSLTRGIEANEQFACLIGLIPTSPTPATTTTAATTALSHRYRWDQWSERVHPDDWPGLRAAVDASRAQRRALDAEYRVVDPDGTERWLNVRGVFQDDDRGESNRFLGVLIDITRRKATEEALRWQQAIQRGIQSVLAAVANCATEQELGRACLAEAERLSESAFGFLDEIDADGQLRVVAISDPGWDVSQVPSSERQPPRSLAIHGIYGRVIRTGRGFFTNDPATHPDHIGLPPGHPPLTAFLGVPLVRDGRIVGLLAVGNRQGGYTQAQQDALEALMPAVVEAFVRKRAEDGLRNATRRFQAIADHAPVAIYVKDRHGRFVFGNRRLEHYTGRPLDRLLGHTDYDFASKEVADRWREHDLETLDSRRVSEFEETGTDSDGRPYVNLSVKFPLADETGALMEIGGISMDITARKQAEAEREADLAALMRMQALSRRGVEAHGIESLLQETMDTAVAIMHADKGTLQMLDGDTLRMVAQHGHRQAFLDYFTAAENVASVWGEATRRGERVIVPDVETSPTFAGTPSLAVMRAAGVRAVQSTPLETRSGRLLGILTTQWATPRAPDQHSLWRVDVLARQVSDVIEQAQADAELREANVSLAEASRRKDEFIAILSHELRNPLAPIRYALPALQSDRLTEASGEALQVIERQVAHLTRLVDDLLDISRITTGKIALRRDHVTLRSVVRAAVEAAAPAVAAGSHSLRVDIPDEPLWVYGDAARLSQAVTNLLDNSAKYTPRGGQLEVSVSREDSRALVCVRDNGVGIPGDQLRTVFEMFHQVNRSEKVQAGLGIGLALVKRLVELHGGAVEARSAGVGLGAEFLVHLPVAAEVAPRAVEVAPASAVQRRLRVLVVDDNADLVAMLAVFVEGFGHEVRKAFDGPSAVSAAVSYRPDVVLLDLGLPRMTGLDVARELRRRPETGSARIVALTGWGQSDDRQATEDAGFDAHLTKPTDPAVLEALLNCERRTCEACVDTCAARRQTVTAERRRP